MQETNFDRQKAFDNLQADDDGGSLERHEIPLDVRAEEQDLDKKDHTLGTIEAVVEPHIPVSTVPLRSWRPWMEAVTLSPHASGVMRRGIFQPIALLGLPMVWWLGLMYGIYQIWFNSEWDIPNPYPLRNVESQSFPQPSVHSSHLPCRRHPTVSHPVSSACLRRN